MALLMFIGVPGNAGATMRKLIASLALGSCLIGSAAISGAVSDDAKAIYEAAAEHAASEFRDAHVKCDALNGNAQDVCIAEAKARQTRAKGEAEAHYKNTAKARIKARTDLAHAEYVVAEVRCGSKAGKDKDICIKEAKATRTAAIAEAKVDKKVNAEYSAARVDRETAITIAGESVVHQAMPGKKDVWVRQTANNRINGEPAACKNA
jgi:hypothetical protein